MTVLDAQLQQQQTHSKSAPGVTPPPAPGPLPLPAVVYTYAPSTPDLVQEGVARQDVVLEDAPFASGGVCQAYRAWFVAEGRRGPLRVAKRWKTKDAQNGFSEDHAAWYHAHTLALAFNAATAAAGASIPSVAFVGCNTLMECAGEWYSVEDFIDGSYTKFNNIFGGIENIDSTIFPAAAAAFSHFSFVHTGHQFGILDVQGVGTTYTDPAVVSRVASQHGYTDTGDAGWAGFFRNHRCNDFCHQLSLPAIHGDWLPAPGHPTGSAPFQGHRPSPLLYPAPNRAIPTGPGSSESPGSPTSLGTPRYGSPTIWPPGAAYPVPPPASPTFLPPYALGPVMVTVMGGPPVSSSYAPHAAVRFLPRSLTPFTRLRRGLTAAFVR